MEQPSHPDISTLRIHTHPQIAVHGDPPSKLTEKGYRHFLVDSPLDSVSVSQVRHPGRTCVYHAQWQLLAPCRRPLWPVSVHGGV